MNAWSTLKDSHLTESPIVDHLETQGCNQETILDLMELFLPLQAKGLKEFYMCGDATDGIEVIWDDEVDVLRVHFMTNGTFSVWMGHRMTGTDLASYCHIFPIQELAQGRQAIVDRFPPLHGQCTCLLTQPGCSYCRYIVSYIR